jgi:hypothetical protein
MVDFTPVNIRLVANECSSKCSDMCSITSGTTSGKESKASNTNDSIKNHISRDQTKAVSRQKSLVLTIMVLSTIAVCFVVHFITKNSEQDDIQSQLDAAAGKLVYTFREVLYKVGTISSLDLAATVHGIDHHLKWPFVTLSSFPERSATAKMLSGALKVSIDPLVTDDDRAQFEVYAAANEEMWK